MTQPIIHSVFRNFAPRNNIFSGDIGYSRLSIIIFPINSYSSLFGRSQLIIDDNNLFGSNACIFNFLRPSESVVVQMASVTATDERDFRFVSPSKLAVST